MTFRFAEPWALPFGLLIAAAAVLAAVLASRLLRPAAAVPLRRRLLLLRIPAVLLLAALLLEPTIARERLRGEDLAVVVLLDRSASMAVPDSWEGRPRHRVAAEFLSGPGTGLADLLGDDFRIVALAFDTAARAATEAERTGGPLPSGSLTDVAEALRAAGRAAPRGETVAVVLLSDGADNAGGDARNAAAEAGVPVYAVGFGSRADAGRRRRDLALVSVDAPETAFAGNTVAVEAALRSSGYDLADPGNRKVRVVLAEGDKEVASEVVEFAEDAPVRVALRFVPEGPGTRTYRIRIPLRPDEAVEGNNARTFPLAVRERSASVLYFDATMRWEAKFLRDLLARDAAFSLTSVLHSGQGRLIVNGDPRGADLSRGLPPDAAGLSNFDVVVLGDVAADALPPGALEALRAWVEDGGGLLTLGGYHAYAAGGYAGTPLAEALPVFLSAEDGQVEEALRLTLTPEGRVHPALSGLEPYFAGKAPPSLEGMTAVRKEKPGAQVLLAAEGADGARRGIVLAAHLYGEGRAAAFTGDTTWVWYRSPELGGSEGLYPRFWGQVLRWLLEEEPEVEQAGEPVVTFPDRPEYRLGETAKIRVRVRDDKGAPVSDAEVDLALAGPGGNRRLTPLPLPRVPGHYEDRFRALVPGDYALSAAAARGGTALGRGTASFRVLPESVEMDDVDLDEDLLGGVARASGGRYYLGSPSAEAVAGDIRGSLVSLVEREETALADAPLFLLLFVGLLTGEWLLRRRRNLL